MHRLFWPVVAVIGVAACGAPAKQDPKAPALEPAVVNIPSTVRVPKPAAPQTPAAAIIPGDLTQRMLPLASGYSLIGTTMVLRDARVLAQIYAPNAVLRVPDSSVTGGPAVVRQLMSLAQSKSLADFQRRSAGTRILDDSTLLDSGTYVMVLRRSPQDSVLERGRYSATWRANADITKWVILEDHIQPGQPARMKGAK